MSDAVKPQLHGRDHRVGGRDPIPGIGIPWISVYDNQYYGQAINTSSSGDNLQFPYIDWSDDASGIFTYVQSSSTIGASNNYNPKLLVDGVYLFSWDEHSDALGNNDYSVEYFLPVNSTPGGTAENRWKEYVTAGAPWSTANFRAMGSIMLPVDVGAGLTIYPYIAVGKESADSNFDITFRNKLWIGYLGPLNNSATFNSSHHNDPYPTMP